MMGLFLLAVGLLAGGAIMIGSFLLLSKPEDPDCCCPWCGVD